MCTCDDEVCSVGLSRKRVVPRVQKLRRHGFARRRGEILCIVRVGRGSVSTVYVGNASAFYKSRIKKVCFTQRASVIKASVSTRCISLEMNEWCIKSSKDGRQSVNLNAQRKQAATT